MSKVDMSVFEDVLEVYQGSSLAEMLFNMCEGDFGVKLDSFKELPPWPCFSLKESDPESYAEQYEAYKTIREYNGILEQEYLDSIGFEHLEQSGGGEGGGEYCYGVFSLKGKYYRCNYSYYSYDGHDYDYIADTVEEVIPVEKTVIVYESVK